MSASTFDQCGFAKASEIRKRPASNAKLAPWQFRGDEKSRITETRIGSIRQSQSRNSERRSQKVGSGGVAARNFVRIGGAIVEPENSPTQRRGALRFERRRRRQQQQQLQLWRRRRAPDIDVAAAAGRRRDADGLASTPSIGSCVFLSPLGIARPHKHGRKVEPPTPTPRPPPPRALAAFDRKIKEKSTGKSAAECRDQSASTAAPPFQA